MDIEKPVRIGFMTYRGKIIKNKKKKLGEGTEAGEYLLTYIRHLEEQLRKLETEKFTNFIHIFGDILEILLGIIIGASNLRGQRLQDVTSKISNVLEEVKKIEKNLQEPSEKLSKWYELRSIEANQFPVRHSKMEQEEKKSHDYEFKIIMLGVPEKTAFIHKFITGVYSEDVRMTTGIDFSIKNFEVDGKMVKIQILDFAAEERFRFLLPKFVSDADGGILMYDVVDTKVLTEISEIIDIIRKNAGTIPLFLGASEVPPKEGQFADFTKKYTLAEITSEIGTKGEHAFELLTKKILEYKPF